MKKLLSSLLGAIALSVGVAYAGSNPGFVTGQVPTAAQWNSYFTAKEDELGYTPVNKAGDTMLGELILPPAGSVASLNIAPGSTPATLNNGDIWATGSGLFYRSGGSTIGPLGSGGGGGTPGGSSGQLQFNNAGSFGGVPTVNGDGTLNTSTGLLNVTKTNGSSFVSSAIVDTTNAGNITSGILAVQRLGTSFTNGQIPIGSGADGLLHYAVPIAGANMTITVGPGTLTFASTGGGGGGGCTPAGSATDVLTDNGAGNCTSNAGLTYTAGVLTIGTPTALLGKLGLAGSTSGTTTLQPQAIASGTLSLPALTDTLVSRTSTDTLSNKTLTSPTIATILNGGTLSLPTSSDTLVGRATTDTLTNKSIAGSEINSGTVPVAQLPVATSGALGVVRADNSSIVNTAGVLSAPGSGGGTVSSALAGQIGAWATNSTTITGYTPSSNFILDNTAHTINIGSPGRTAATSTAFGTADMGGTINLNSTTAQNLTINAVATGLFAANMVSCYTVTGTGTWTLVQGTYTGTFPPSGLPIVTLKPGANGCLQSDGTNVFFAGGVVGGDLYAVNTIGAEFTNTSNTLHIASGGITSSLIQTSIALGGNPTTTTQAANDNSTKIGTTAYADRVGTNLLSANSAITGTWTAATQAANDNSTKIATTAYVDRPPTFATGTTHTFAGSNDIFECTGTCTITMPTPANGVQYCVRNANNIATTITFSGLASVQYENTNFTSYKAANTAIASSGAAGDKMCYVGNGTTKYDVYSFNGTWS